MQRNNSVQVLYVNSNELDPAALANSFSPLFFFPSFLHQTNPPRLELEVFDFAPPPLSLVSARAREEREPFCLSNQIKGRPSLPRAPARGERRRNGDEAFARGGGGGRVRARVSFPDSI